MGKEKIRSFSGEILESAKVEDPTEWIRDYERACNVNDWDNDRKKIQHFPFHLTGEAKTWYNVWNDWMEDAGRTWIEVKGQFLQRFRPITYEQELEDRLYHPK